VNNKLGRDKTARSPTKRKQEQSYNWMRILGHREVVGFKKDEDGNPVINKLGHRSNIYNHVGGIYELENPTQVDLWWAKDFLIRVAKHPASKREKKVDIRMVSYNPSEYGMRRFKKTVPESFAAELVLRELIKKWPELAQDRIEPKQAKPVKRFKKVKPVKKFKSDAAAGIARCALRGVRKKLKEIQRKSDHWEARLRRMVIMNPKWKETLEKTQIIRQEVLRLENHQKELKLRLK